MRNRVRSSLILGFGILLFLFLWNIKPSCLILETFGFPCPACGMTHAFVKIFELDFLGAFTQNILAVPLFIFLIILTVFLIYDIITGKNICLTFVFKFFEKYYIVIIILIIISWVIDIIKYF